MALHSSADQTLMPNFTDPDTLVRETFWRPVV